MRLSVVATLYKSESYVAEFCHRTLNVSRKIAGDDFELVLVNDGSPDASLAIAVELSASEPNIVIVDLSRNFGHHKAIMAGLTYAHGERVFLIDSDLEEQPEWLADFHEQMNQATCDVVYGVQDRRKGNWFDRWSGSAYYWLFNRLSDVAIPKNILVVRLMTRRYVKALLLHGEHEVFLAGLGQLTGFGQQPWVVAKQVRGNTTYTLSRKISLLVNSITSFSNKPLVYIFYVGLLLSSCAGLYTLLLAFNWFFLARPLVGWTSVIASIWLLGGLIICFIGILGIYLSRVFSETKGRPNTIVKDIYRGGSSGTGTA